MKRKQGIEKTEEIEKLTDEMSKINRKTISAIVADNLKKYREERGFTQATMAEITGMSVSNYSGIENGDKLLTVVNLLKFSTLFTISSDSIIRPQSADSDIDDIKLLLEGKSSATRKTVIDVTRNIVNMEVPESED